MLQIHRIHLALTAFLALATTAPRPARCDEPKLAPEQKVAWIRLWEKVSDDPDPAKRWKSAGQASGFILKEEGEFYLVGAGHLELERVDGVVVPRSKNPTRLGVTLPDGTHFGVDWRDTISKDYRRGDHAIVRLDQSKFPGGAAKLEQLAFVFGKSPEVLKGEGELRTLLGYSVSTRKPASPRLCDQLTVKTGPRVVGDWAASTFLVAGDDDLSGASGGPVLDVAGNIAGCTRTQSHRTGEQSGELLTRAFWADNYWNRALGEFRSQYQGKPITAVGYSDSHELRSAIREVTHPIYEDFPAE